MHTHKSSDLTALGEEKAGCQLHTQVGTRNQMHTRTQMHEWTHAAHMQVLELLPLARPPLLPH